MTYERREQNFSLLHFNYTAFCIVETGRIYLTGAMLLIGTNPGACAANIKPGIITVVVDIS